jgi:hypothetical protein
MTGGHAWQPVARGRWWSAANEAPQVAPGLHAWLEHAADWETLRRTGFNFPLQPPPISKVLLCACSCGWWRNTCRRTVQIQTPVHASAQWPSFTVSVPASMPTSIFHNREPPDGSRAVVSLKSVPHVSLNARHA